MKRLFILVAIAMFACASCSGSSNPEKLTKAFLTAIQKGDFAKAATMVDIPAESQKEAAEEFAQEFSGDKGVKSFEILECKVNDTKAAAKVKIIYKNGSDDDATIELNKVDGKWKTSL